MWVRIVVCVVVGFVTLALWLASAEAAAASGWSIQQTPNPAGAQDHELESVSCASTRACTAVGTGVASAERWNGASWSIQPTPNLGGAIGSGLNGVSCASKTACTAVGTFTNRADAFVTLAERWNGDSWAIQPTPSSGPKNGSSFGGVSCASPTACTAVGFFTNRADVLATLAERWNGASWAIQRTPSPGDPNGAALGSVSCASPTACTAVGFFTAGTRLPLAERWNGASWAIQRTPSPGGKNDSGLLSVSCRSTSACTAVGFFTNRAGTAVTLAERWNGTSWSIQPIPNPAGAKDSHLDGVSCTSKTACTAVGSFINRAGTLVPLAERWNGASWAIQRTPSPGGKNDSGLLSVSCRSTSACTAVGFFTNRAGTTMALAERYS
jgi:hypothetical protein